MLENLRGRFAEKDLMKQAASAARKKDKEDKAKGEQLRAEALLTMHEGEAPELRRYTASPTSQIKCKLDLADVWQEKKELKVNEHSLRARELALREREIALQEDKAEQAKEENKRNDARAEKTQETMLTMMQQQMQHLAQIAAALSKN